VTRTAVTAVVPDGRCAFSPTAPGACSAAVVSVRDIWKAAGSVPVVQTEARTWVVPVPKTWTCTLSGVPAV
jgi:hypothetical protein